MKVFVGYPSEHRSEAREVAGYLRSQGEEVWLDVDALAGGDDWDAERLEAQRRADFIIHLCSNAINSRGGPVVREIHETLRLLEDQPFRSNLALCMRLEDVRLPSELMSLHYIDIFRGGWKQQLDKAIGKRKAQLEGAAITHPLEIDVTSVEHSTVEPKAVTVSEKLKHLAVC